MSIIECSQIGQGRSGDNSKDGHRMYTVVFQVIVSNAYDGPGVVVLGNGIPTLYQEYTGFENRNDRDALCIGVKPEQDGNEWQKWRVTCTFSTNWADSGQPNQNPNPEEDPALFWIETEFAEQATTKTWNKKPIRNSSGQLYDGLTRFRSNETWIWEKNFSSIQRSTWKAYQNAVNSDTIDEIEPNQGLLFISVPKPAFRNSQPFYRVQFRVRVNTEGWNPTPLDQGTMVLNSSDLWEQPRDAQNKPIDGMVFLNGSGKVHPDQGKTDFEPFELPKAELYEPKPFANLGDFFGS